MGMSNKYLLIGHPYSNLVIFYIGAPAVIETSFHYPRRRWGVSKEFSDTPSVNNLFRVVILYLGKFLSDIFL